MVATADYYADLLDQASWTTESAVLVVAGATRDEVAEVLGVDLARPVDALGDDVDSTAWSLLELTGPDGSLVAVLGLEATGYGDPSVEALTRLSGYGRAAAVVRDNVQAHCRFGCARDGELLFDDDEYVYLEDPDVVPEEIRTLFDLVHDDLEGEIDDADESTPSPYAVGLAMAEVVTGVALTADDVRRALESGRFHAPSLVYP